MRVQRRRFGVKWFAVVTSVALWNDAPSAGGAAPFGAEPDASPVAAQADRARSAARSAGCSLFTGRARTSTSADCLACHGKGASAEQRRACHPVAIDYASASRSRSSLRPIDEVVRRGVFLPDRELRCVTCHDERSPWAHAVALPPGSTPTVAVDALHPRALDQPPSLAVPGDHVNAKPLCLACHVLD